MTEDADGHMHNQPSLSSALQRSHRLAARFCLLELQFANAILDHADITRGGPHHDNSVARARSVRDGLVRILERFHPTGDDAQIVGSGLEQLEQRLADEDVSDGQREPRHRATP